MAVAPINPSSQDVDHLGLTLNKQASKRQHLCQEGVNGLTGPAQIRQAIGGQSATDLNPNEMKILHPEYTVFPNKAYPLIVLHLPLQSPSK